MKYLPILWVSIIIGVLLPFNSYSQDLKDKESVVINGRKYLIHQVRSAETVYSLCKKYGITEKELRDVNPELKDGLKAGMKLKFPFNNEVEPASANNQTKREPDSFINHIIQKKETPYYISKKFGITIDELNTYNPDLGKFAKGKSIRIPQWNAIINNQGGGLVKNTEKEEIKFIEYIVKKGDTPYSVSKRFNVSIPEILHYNPDALNLKEGSVLKIPSLKNQNNNTEQAQGINEKKANFHIIESGETLYGLTKKYNVTKEELIELNPVLAGSFPVGAVLKIPGKNQQESGTVRNNEIPVLKKHVVQKGETLYSLSRNYEAEISEIKKYNPALGYREIVEGETIFIPQVDSKSSVMSGSSYPDLTGKNSSFLNDGPALKIPNRCQTDGSKISQKNIRVAIFLPLYLSENEEIFQEREVEISGNNNGNNVKYSDTLNYIGSESENINDFFRNSENFLCFYEGVLLAIDSLKSLGINVNLTIYDTRQDQNAIRNVISSEKLRETHLIIGPVYPEQQSDIAGFAAKNRIPIISPLSSSSDKVNSNSYYFQVNPSREYINSRTAELIAKDFSDSNFIVLSAGSPDKTTEEDLVEKIREKITNTGYYSNDDRIKYQVYDYGKYGISDISRMLSKDKENVLFISTMKEGELSVILSNLKNLTAEYSITLVGSNKYQQFESIEQENYFHLKLAYFSPYWVDYNSAPTVNFISQFRNVFKTEPNEFGFQGFDVTYFFCNLIGNYGKDFYDCLPYVNGVLTQGTYHFDKVSEFGGYMNQGISLIKYQNDFSVNRAKIAGLPNLVLK